LASTPVARLIDHDVPTSRPSDSSTTHASAPPASGSANRNIDVCRQLRPSSSEKTASIWSRSTTTDGSNVLYGAYEAIQRPRLVTVSGPGASAEPGIGIGMTVGRLHVWPLSVERAHTRSFCFSACRSPFHQLSPGRPTGVVVP